eukprot:2050117-Alexandrium_andersonii.AAC.1
MVFAVLASTSATRCLRPSPRGIGKGVQALRGWGWAGSVLRGFSELTFPAQPSLERKPSRLNHHPCQSLPAQASLGPCLPSLSVLRSAHLPDCPLAWLTAGPSTRLLFTGVRG